MKKLNFIYIFIFLLIAVTLTASINIIKLYVKDSTAISTTTELPFSLTSSTNFEKKHYTVVLDAGHGGKDSGSIGPNGTLEKDIALAVTLKIGDILQKKDVNVIYIRKDDNITWTTKKEELLNRAEISNKNNADIFVSIHMNSSSYKDVGGTETYYNPISPDGKKLANIIQATIAKEITLRNRGIKPETYSVLRNVAAPSALIELAYISNAKEESMLALPDFQYKFAQAIADGIIDYFE